MVGLLADKHFPKIWVWYLLIKFCLTADINISWQNDNPHIVVSDNFFDVNSIDRLRSWLLLSNDWKLNSEISPGNLPVVRRNGFRVNGIKANEWIAETVVTKVEKAAQKLYKNDFKRDLLLSSAHAFIVEKLDYPVPTNSCTKEGSVLAAILVLSENTVGNGYGEIVIYPDYEGVVIRAMTSLKGRLIFLPCQTHFRVTPPSLASPNPVSYMMLGFSLNGTELQSSKISALLADENVPKTEQLDQFLQKNVPAELLTRRQLDIKQLLSNVLSLKNGQQVVVIDNFLPVEVTRALQLYANNNVLYRLNIVKTGSKRFTKTFLLPDDDFQQSWLWYYLQQVTSFLSGGTEFYPYEVSLTHRRLIDDDSAHSDSLPMEKEYSISINLSPNLTVNEYGEMVFYENNEIVKIIRPQFGRVVVYSGSTQHSVRPPSPNIPGPVYSILVKTTSNRRVAWEKMLQHRSSLVTVKKQIEAFNFKDEGDKTDLLDIIESLETEENKSKRESLKKRFGTVVSLALGQ